MSLGVAKRPPKPTSLDNTCFVLQDPKSTPSAVYSNVVLVALVRPEGVQSELEERRSLQHEFTIDPETSLLGPVR